MPCARATACASSQVHGLGAGSLQRYINHEGFAGDFGPSIFPMLEVQKIAVLDICIANLDQHGGNLLVSKGTGCECRLTPIDHALSLPQWDHLNDIWLDRLSLPQACAPLTEHVHQYTSRFNGRTDAHMLVQLSICPECAVTVHITTLLLQIRVNTRLTLGLISATKYYIHRLCLSTRNLRPAGQILGSEPSGTNLVVVSGGWLFAEVAWQKD